MGYLSCSCNAESAISTCDPYNWDFSNKKNKNLPTKSFKLRDFSYSHLQSATNAFSDSNFLGKGSHGSVYKAHLDNGKLVAAVKRTILTPDKFKFTNNPSDNEIEILSRVRSPRLVNLLGFGVDSSHRTLIVVEFMPNGSLYDLLHTANKPPGWAKRLRLASQVAKAVQLLHASNPPVIHRDIKSSNVLIDGEWNARLGDFGLALRGHVEDVRVSCTPPAGTLGYLDPGYLAPGDLSTKSDVFSFGILLLEIISGRNAIDMNYSPPSVVDWAVPMIKSGDFDGICDPRIGPPEDSAAIEKLLMLAVKCVRSTAEKRPDMADVVEWLRVLRKRVKSPIWNNLRRRVRRSSPTTKYKPFDDSREMSKTLRTGGCRRNRKISSVASVDLVSDAIDVARDRMGRSKSIGSVTDTKLRQLDSNIGGNSNSSVANAVGLYRKKGGLGVSMPTVRLSKSRSAGVLQGTRLIDNSGVFRNPNGKEFEESKLLIIKINNK
ncbi:hypothetical protein LguiB_019790 [Lonicera macranthoides]